MREIGAGRVLGSWQCTAWLRPRSAAAASTRLHGVKRVKQQLLASRELRVRCTGGHRRDKIHINSRRWCRTWQTECVSPGAAARLERGLGVSAVRCGDGPRAICPVRVPDTQLQPGLGQVAQEVGTHHRVVRFGGGGNIQVFLTAVFVLCK